MSNLDPALHAYLVELMSEPETATQGVELALVAAGAKPAWLWELVGERELPPCSVPQVFYEKLAEKLRTAGWHVRYEHVDRPISLGVGCLMALIPARARPAIHYDAIFAAPTAAPVDELVAAYLFARPKVTREGEIRLGAALGYPPIATRTGGAHLTSLEDDCEQFDGLWICGFVEGPAGRAEAQEYLSRWDRALRAEFPEAWPRPAADTQSTTRP
jgi:hypothetical protein